MVVKSTTTACIISALISEAIAEATRLSADAVAAYTLYHRKVEVNQGMAAQNVKILRKI